MLSNVNQPTGTTVLGAARMPMAPTAAVPAVDADTTKGSPAWSPPD